MIVGLICLEMMNSQPSYCDPVDLELIRLCLSGDEVAFDTMVTRFGRMIGEVVYRTAIRRNCELSDSKREEIVAKVLVELFSRDGEALRNFSGHSTFSTYLTVIARRVTIREII